MLVEVILCFLVVWSFNLHFLSFFFHFGRSFFWDLFYWWNNRTWSWIMDVICSLPTILRTNEIQKSLDNVQHSSNPIVWQVCKCQRVNFLVCRLPQFVNVDVKNVSVCLLPGTKLFWRHLDHTHHPILRSKVSIATWYRPNLDNLVIFIHLLGSILLDGDSDWRWHHFYLPKRSGVDVVGEVTMTDGWIDCVFTQRHFVLK